MQEERKQNYYEDGILVEMIEQSEDMNIDQQRHVQVTRLAKCLQNSNSQKRDFKSLPMCS